MRVKVVAAIVSASLFTCASAWAAEVITYSYDGKGRLMRVERSGNVNNGVVANYQYDQTDSRTRVQVTGSTNPPPS